MRIVIVGCGRVGAVVAGSLDGAGHEVVIIDSVTSAFDRLPAAFRGSAIRADGTDEDSLRRAGAERADVFLALTEGDNRNIMAAQLAVEVLGVQRVVAKINDPVRAEAYADLGIPTICRTEMMAYALLGFMGVSTPEPPGVRAAEPHPHHTADETARGGVGGHLATTVGVTPAPEA
jgi:trk system potassium uptake protein